MSATATVEFAIERQQLREEIRRAEREAESLAREGRQSDAYHARQHAGSLRVLLAGLSGQ